MRSLLYLAPFTVPLFAEMIWLQEWVIVVPMGVMIGLGLWCMAPGDPLRGRAASPSDLSQQAASCKHCIPIAGDVK